MISRTFISIIYILFAKGSFAQPAESPLKITPLTGDFYIFTTYNLYKGNKIPANGMYLVTEKGTVLFDSPWDTAQFQPLLDSIRTRHHKEVIACIATHFHEDRTGGLDFYRRLGIKTYTTRQTDELSQKRGMKRAEFLMNKDTLFSIGQYSFETYYPGPGHAPDNIVIWFEKQKILYGGCLIKSMEDDNLGNLGDASISGYAATIKNVLHKCPKPAFVIPGHNDWTSTRSVKHTLKMAKQLKRKN
jgi:metallo-beta-lactamase class B